MKSAKWTHSIFASRVAESREFAATISAKVLADRGISKLKIKEVPNALENIFNAAGNAIKIGGVANLQM